MPMLHPTRAHARDAERGFTVVEIVVAMIIAIVLISLAIIAFRGSKTATYANEGKAVGSAYMQMVSQYQADHANNNPAPGQPGGVPNGNNGAAQKKGPINLLAKPYGSIPDAVAAGRVGVSFGSNCGNAAGTPVGAGGHRAWVSVCLEPAPNYGVRVITRGPSNTWAAGDAKVCWMGSTAKTPRC